MMPYGCPPLLLRRLEMAQMSAQRQQDFSRFCQEIWDNAWTPDGFNEVLKHFMRLYPEGDRLRPLFAIMLNIRNMPSGSDVMHKEVKTLIEEYCEFHIDNWSP